MAFLIVKNAIYEFFSKFLKYIPALFLCVVTFGVLGTFQEEYVIKRILATVLAFFGYIFYFAAYLNRKYFDIFSKNIIPFIFAILFNQIITELLTFLGEFLVGHFFSDPSGTFARTVTFGWNVFSTLITVPLQFCIFEVYKRGLSVAEAFNALLCFFENNFWNKILFYIRLSLAMWVYIIPAIFAFTVLAGLAIAFNSTVFQAIVYILIIPILLVFGTVYEIALCEYCEECELY